MATYKVYVNYQYPDQDGFKLVLTTSDVDEAHTKAKSELDALGYVYEQCNEDQYAPPQLRAGCMVMAHVDAEYSPVEIKARQIDRLAELILKKQDELDDLKRQYTEWANKEV